MNQQINLYLPEFRPRRDHLGAERMLAILGITVALLAIISLASQWQLSGLQARVGGLQAELNASRANTTALANTLSSQTQDQALVSSMGQLEDNYQGKRLLLDFLGAQSHGNVSGFSDHLADLARYHVEGVRITNVDLSNGAQRVMLRGEVFRPELVPLYLQNLSNGRAYLGKNFGSLRIDEGTAGSPVLRFNVASGGN